MVNAYKNGNKKFSQSIVIGGSELVLYFEVEMDQKDIDNFARLLSLSGKVTGFYACVVLNDKTTPRTFVAYKRDDDSVHELFDISTGISPISILKGSIEKGEIL